MTIEDADRDAAAIVSIRCDPEQSEWVRLDENGRLDIPLSVVRQLSEWLRRYDLRPNKPKPVIARDWSPR